MIKREIGKMDKNGGTKQSSRLVVIGLDSADFDLIQKWVHEGHLPTIAGLMESGSWGTLRSTANVGSASVWPSFFSGVSPAKHCGLGRRRLKSGTYRIIHDRNARVIKRDPFWLQLSQAGKRIAVLDVPRTYPSDGFNGIQLVDWGTHDKDWGASSYPREYLKHIIDRFGPYPIPDFNEFLYTNTELSALSEFSKALISSVKKKELVSQYILEQESWDLFITVFSEPHGGGHLLWHLMDRDHPAYDSKIAQLLGDSLLNIYSSIDSAISKLMDVASDVNFLIVSPAGMGPDYTGSHLLPEILKRLDLVVGRQRTPPDNTLSEKIKYSANKLFELVPAGRWGPQAIINLKNMLPVGILKAIEPLKKLIPKQTLNSVKSQLKTIGRSWRSRKAFCTPSDFNGSIRINVKGREPEGLVEPGAEYESLCSDLIRELGNFINIDTGEKAASDVLRVHQMYTGEYLDELPDIVVKWGWGYTS